jgi:hypothetical protein
MPNNVSLNILGLEIPNINLIHQGKRAVIRPITDHPPLVQNTAWGAVATMNMLNPGSPYAPPAQLGGVKSLPANGQQQMEAMALYIFNMFQIGVRLLTLQEVPAPTSANFQFLVNKLKILLGASSLIDVDALANQWLKTGAHAFGTSILYSPSRFTITQNARSVLNNRAAEYEVTDSVTHTKIPVANIHGDYTQQQKTVQYISQFSGICLGDANLSHIDKTTNSLIYQTAERPVLIIEGQRCFVSTYDVIQDSYSKQINPHFVINTAGID